VTIVHKLLNKEVASGVTDQVGKSVIKRRGTLFVGETYVARTPGGPGISAGEASFTVDGGASSARGVEVVIEVVRACASMSFVLKPALVDTQHWARSLPLPERIGFEIVHCESKAVVHAGTAANGSGSVDGQAANLYVGENFWLRVPKSDLLDEATVGFTSSVGETAAMVLRVARAFASVDVVLRSVHAGTSHWASELPLPTGVPLRVLHQSRSGASWRPARPIRTRERGSRPRRCRSSRARSTRSSSTRRRRADHRRARRPSRR